MASLLKIDLHTHPIEALKDGMGIKGIRDINIEVVSAIVKAVKSAGLNGIAVTEHHNFNHGWVTCLEIMDNFRQENLIVLPGAEIEYAGQQFLQIYIPERFRRRIPFFKGKDWFITLAHPGHYNPISSLDFNQVDFDAVEIRSLHGEFSAAGEISRLKGIPVTMSSDAHRLEDIGLFYTELEIL